MAASRFFIIDGNSYLYKSFYAIKGLSSPDGLPTNSIYGFCNLIFKIIKEQSPDYLGVAFDSKGPSFRVDLDSEYKANRQKMPDDLSVQLPYVDRLLEKLQIPVFRIDRIEADDIIATLVERYSGDDVNIYIASSDKDFFQLVLDNVFVFDSSKPDVLDKDYVFEKFGVAPSKFVDYQALIGDSSDNIKGAKGIGKRTAAKLLSQFENIDEMYSRLDEVKNLKVQKILIEHKDSVYLSRKLAKLSRDIPFHADLDALRVTSPDKKALLEFFDELGFERLKKTLEKVFPC